jgi:hypothetical protein
MGAASMEDRERGNVPILVVILLIFLIGSGLAYMKWAADEGAENRYEQAAVQAHYLAQTGISERGFTFLRSRGPGTLPIGRVDLASGGIPGVGEYKDTYVTRNIEIGEYSVFRTERYYTIYSTGVVSFENNKGEGMEVERTHSLLVRLRSFVNYMYLTDLETTIFGERISFWGQDTLWGRVHSNDQFAMMGHPVFYGLVTTSQSSFYQGPGFNPNFVNYAPVFNVPPVEVPDEATVVRNCAGGCGFTFHGEGLYNHRLVFEEDGEYKIYRWEIGTPFDPSAIIQMGPTVGVDAMFFYGPLELTGRLYGQMTVGASGDIRLIDDIIYVDSAPNGLVNPDSPHVLGIVSESNIVVGNTWENGRGNSAQGTDIIINAAMLALGESFTFEDQNDVWELYQGPTPDDRGAIRLWGSVVQKRRGYVHRSNHQSTGYGKDYHYDERFDVMPPPCYPDATDQYGRSLFDLIAWGQ